MDKGRDDRCFSCSAGDGTSDGTSRREFLESAGCFGMMIAMLGLSSGRAFALPVYETEGEQSGSERRYSIPSADSVNIDHASQLIVARVESRVYVFALSCPHQNNAVKWVAKDHRFQCTKHDSQYKPDGVYMAGRSTRNLDRYVISREGESIVVDLHRWVQSDKDPAGWAAAFVAV